MARIIPSEILSWARQVIITSYVWTLTSERLRSQMHAYALVFVSLEDWIPELYKKWSLIRNTGTTAVTAILMVCTRKRISDFCFAQPRKGVKSRLRELLAIKCTLFRQTNDFQQNGNKIRTTIHTHMHSCMHRHEKYIHMHMYACIHTFVYTRVIHASILKCI